MNKHAEMLVNAVVASDKEASAKAFKAGLSEKAHAALAIRKLSLVDQVFNKAKVQKQ